MAKSRLHSSIVASSQILPLSFNEFRSLFTLYKNPKPDFGWLYFKARSKKILLGGIPTMSRDGRRNSILDQAAKAQRDIGLTSLPPNQWRPVVGTVVKDIPAGRTTPVAGDEGECHHSRDDPRRAMSKKISLKKLALMAGGSKGASPGDERDDKKKATSKYRATSSKGETSAVALKEGVIPPIDEEEVGRMDLDSAILMLFHRVGQVVVLASSLIGRGRVTELKKKEALAKKSAIEEYKSSG
ncbi:hypothetical protein Acr_00g0100970 [Actinidia rufa]|uniref:Uncharacterized protein n=1 Tax=Actinidia rufa TaxID=165716 RepID=A0A7J0E0M0_9ERIC|nr:hypothetical protein Acr_00g0100970 [Actinidia rufa]